MKIKSFIYTLLSIVTALLFTGCSDEDIQSPNKDEKMVTWTISVTLPEAQSPDTRAFDNSNFEFTDLHVAVFSEAGGVYFLEQFVKADNTVPEWNSENNCWDFGVTLMQTKTPRRLHLIANYPGLTMGFGEESQLIGRLLTDAGTPQHDVYWNYVDVDSIVKGYETQVQRVPLVRNFAQLKLSIEPKEDVDLRSKFQVEGFAIYNVPKRGTVAPYNSKNGTFANYVVDNEGNKTTKCETYGNLFNSGYEGNEPYDDGTLLSKTITDDDFIGIDRSHYIYERSNRNTTSPTSMIIKAKYEPNGSFGAADYTYYKLDFVYVDSETNTNVYYNILRNFIYTINIKDVTGEGYATIQEAIEKPASNNVSGDVSLKDYTNVSDGKSRLFVSSTYLVFTNDSPIDLYYQHRPDIETSPNGINNSHGTGGHVTINAPAGDVLQSATVATNDEPAGSNHAGWRKITLTPKSPEAGSVYRQDITVATRDLQRQITLVLRTPYNLGVEVDEYVLREQGAPLDVKITIPGGMPSSLFPLRLFISTDKNTIDPQPGTQMPAEAMNGKYGFIKEISYMYYSTATTNGDGWNVAKKEANGDVSFVTAFRSNCAASAATVQVSNQYFNTGSDSFTNTGSYSTVTMRAGAGVDIEQTMGRYPQTIYNNGDNDGIITGVKIYVGGNYTGKTITIDKNSVLTEATLENISGLNLDTEITFKFSDNYYAGNNNWSAGTVEYTATSTLRDIKKRATLYFTATGIPLYEIKIPTTTGVSIQQVNNRYPERIYGTGNNNGEESVTVSLNGNRLGTVKINRSNVTEGNIFTIASGVNLDDELTFTFTDNCWFYFNWSTSPATYTATATVAQINAGTTLNFKATNVPRLTQFTLGSDVYGDVDIQRLYGRYPLNIYNNGNNNGTETVTVTYNGKNVGIATIADDNSIGTITIDRDNVTNAGDITISNSEGIEMDDELVFTFTDSYYWNNNWVTTGIQYTATATLGDLIEGNRITLKFEANTTSSNITTSNSATIRTSTFTSVTVNSTNAISQNSNVTGNIYYKDKSVASFRISRDKNGTYSISRINNNSNGSYSLTDDMGIDESELELRFTSGSNTYKASFTFDGLKNGGTLNFTRQ